MVTTVVPTSSGTLALQAVVPEALPESPDEVVHFTAATPTLSLAVPVNENAAAVVETIVEPGDTICSVGGTVSGPEGVGVGGGAGAGGGVGVGVGAGVGDGPDAEEPPGFPYRA